MSNGPEPHEKVAPPVTVDYPPFPEGYVYIVEPEDVPNFADFTIPKMTGANGGFTQEQRYVVKYLYMPKWIELEAANPPKSEETAWKTKAVMEIVRLWPFKYLASQPPLTRSTADWHLVSTS